MQFYLISWQGKEYFTILNQKSGAGAGFFWLLGAGAGIAKKNTRSRSRLKKKSGARTIAGADKNLAGSPAPFADNFHISDNFLMSADIH